MKFTSVLGLFLSIISLNFSYGQNCQCFDFVWHGDSVSGRYLAEASMNIPVTIDDLPHDFTMQLDLGAVTTQLYENSLQPYLETYPSLIGKVDSTKTFMSNSEEHIMLVEMNLKMGDAQFKGIDIGLLSGYGDVISKDSINTTSTKHIGTIAPDIFKNKIITIDYPNNRICVYDDTPETHFDVDFMDLEVDHGRIKIPFNINGREEMLMFDTGSSLFSLITSEANAKSLSDGTVIDSLKVNSWGTLLSAYGFKTDKDVKFGSAKLPQALVYYVDNPNFEVFFEKEGIWGITGNAYFLSNTLIIDYRNRKIAIK